MCSLSIFSLVVVHIHVPLQESENDYERPWQSEVPPLEENVEIVEKYPSDEEEHGIVSVGWRGPLCKVISVMLLHELHSVTLVTDSGFVLFTMYSRFELKPFRIIVACF